MMLDTCPKCKHYHEKGVVNFTSNDGIPIHQGPCAQYSFYNHEAAFSVCKGLLLEAKE